LQRRLPKSGFTPLPAAGRVAEVRLRDLARLEGEVVTVSALEVAGLVPRGTRHAKVILTGTVERPVVLQGVAATRGARAAIEAAGGRVEA
jgi:large subunit ribosomal protein L15